VLQPGQGAGKPSRQEAKPIAEALVCLTVIRGLAATLLAGTVFLGPAAASAAHPQVTVISDSVAAALGYDRAAERILARGLDLHLELRGCRRLSTTGCPDGHGVPPSALDLIRFEGAGIGRNVVIAVGYNDASTTYVPGIEPTLRALKADGVQRVFWLTLRAAHHTYLDSNVAIKAAAKHHREMVVLDWNRYSRGHPDWFRSDGVHLVDAGGQALARFVHDHVLRALVTAQPH
jgi:hypothetical protein